VTNLPLATGNKGVLGMVADKICGECHKQIPGNATECPECSAEFVLPGDALDLSWTACFKLAFAFLVVFVVTWVLFQVLKGIF